MEQVIIASVLLLLFFVFVVIFTPFPESTLKQLPFTDVGDMSWKEPLSMYSGSAVKVEFQSFRPDRVHSVAGSPPSQVYPEQFSVTGNLTSQWGSRLSTSPEQENDWLFFREIHKSLGARVFPLRDFDYSIYPEDLE